MDDPKVTEEAHVTTLKDEWLIIYGNLTPETKAWIKKIVEAEKKNFEKENKVCEKVKGKS